MSRTTRPGPILLALLAAACSDAPAPSAATSEPPVSASTEAAPEPDMSLPEELPVDPVDASLTAAAGLPQELATPLVDGLSLGFEYGTLLDVAADAGSERQVLIEPIGVAMDEAVASLERSLHAAGFEPVATVAEARPDARHFRRHPAQGPDQVLSLEATPYPDPESAAHPGGTGVIALRLETRNHRG